MKPWINYLPQDIPEFYVIGDIAGDFDTLEALVSKLDTSLPIISVGDMCDRGHKSPQVFEFFQQPNRMAILGNHEHMMMDWMQHRTFLLHAESRVYDRECWIGNGGINTILSMIECSDREKHALDYLYHHWTNGIYVGQEAWESFKVNLNDIQYAIIEKHAKTLEWLDGLPVAIDMPSIRITHAPQPSRGDRMPMGVYSSGDEWLLSNAFKNREDTMLWNRTVCDNDNDYEYNKLVIYGHNSSKKTVVKKKSIGIDTLGAGKFLTALHVIVTNDDKLAIRTESITQGKVL